MWQGGARKTLHHDLRCQDCGDVEEREVVFVRVCDEVGEHVGAMGAV